MIARLGRSLWVRIGLVLLTFALAFVAMWWRGPDWTAVYHSFDFVEWRWIFAAFSLNLVSVLFRAIAWSLVIRQALPLPHPRFVDVFSAFAIGLLANVVLPARAGELARVAVLGRKLPHGPGTNATLIGTVFAHRLFDLVPAGLLVLYVASAARIPHWAVTSLIIFFLVGVALFAVALLSARRHQRPMSGTAGRLRGLLTMAQQGLAVMHAPLAAAGAIVFQILGWLMQLLAVWVAMRAFDIHAPLAAAAVVLLLMNVATIFPLWPGNIGLLQAAVALPLREYGVPYATGFAFGLVLQAVEMSVGVGVGLVFLAREGLSFASLRGMEEKEERIEDELAHVVASQSEERVPAEVSRR